MLVTVLCLAALFTVGVPVRDWAMASGIRSRLRAGEPAPSGLGSRKHLRPRKPIPPSVQTLAALLDDIARRCASGETLAHAFTASREVVELSPLFDHTLAGLQRGATFAEALHSQPADTAAVALVVHVLGLCARVGGNISEPLDRAAATLRERHAAAQERVAQSAQARLSVRVLTLVPIAFAGWTLLTSTDVQRFVLTPVGLVSVAVGLALNLAGWRMMQRIISGLR
ncbi:unannotated protein [freshwater metagenome]|uniref:Unannotated protein n=1 Tax=freshwater metagenome TaxID=449393 RepID=A0A6J7FK43_9ZZZZ|nr:hypothetical protein [Actinomycetota bacterium]